MSRLIDAEEVIKAVDKHTFDTKDGLCLDDDISIILEDVPTIEERKTGKWIYKRDLKQFFCDQCGYPSLTDDDRYIYGMDLPNFCEDCGADMRGEQDG